jgi:hypothetical protein
MHVRMVADGTVVQVDDGAAAVRLLSEGLAVAVPAPVETAAVAPSVAEPKAKQRKA